MADTSSEKDLSWLDGVKRVLEPLFQSTVPSQKPAAKKTKARRPRADLAKPAKPAKRAKKTAQKTAVKPAV